MEPVELVRQDTGVRSVHARAFVRRAAPREIRNTKASQVRELRVDQRVGRHCGPAEVQFLELVRERALGKLRDRIPIERVLYLRRARPYCGALTIQGEVPGSLTRAYPRALRRMTISNPVGTRSKRENHHGPMGRAGSTWISVLDQRHGV